MMHGHVRDYLPRIVLTLPGIQGPMRIEFIIDTGFDGDLALPTSLVRQLDVTFSADRIIRLADGTMQRRPCFSIPLEWNEEIRETEITVLENAPLLGAVLMDGFLLQIEMTNNGEVTLDLL
jgi:clan AA aspartic protease